MYSPFDQSEADGEVPKRTVRIGAVDWIVRRVHVPIALDIKRITDDILLRPSPELRIVPAVAGPVEPGGAGAVVAIEERPSLEPVWLPFASNVYVVAPVGLLADPERGV